MPLFRFANISGPKKIDKKESEKKNNLEAEKDAELESILEKHPSGFSIEEIVDAELQNGDEEEKRNLKDDLLNFISKKKESELKGYEKNLHSKNQNEELEAITEALREKIFNELTLKLTEDYIQTCKKIYYSRNLEQKEPPFFVGMACRQLALEYLKNIQVVANKENLTKAKNKFKDFYYNKNKKPHIPPSNIRNFYEVEKPEDNPEE